MPETIRDIVEAILETAEVEPRSTLIVHSSFRSLSRHGVEAGKFIEGLIDYLDGGTLLMPAMSWRIVTPDNPVFDELETPSHVGVLAEVFRTRYATHRSIHPTHSTAAVGPLARRMTERHHLFTTPCPPESPFGLLAKVDARILLLDVDLERCTAVHCVEELVAPDFYLKPEIEPYTGIDRNGRRLDLGIRRHRCLERDFAKFEPALAASGRLLSGKFADTEWRAIGAAALHAELLTILQDCPYGTLSDAALKSGARQGQAI